MWEGERPRESQRRGPGETVCASLAVWLVRSLPSFPNLPTPKTDWEINCCYYCMVLYRYKAPVVLLTEVQYFADVLLSRTLQLQCVQGTFGPLVAHFGCP